VDDLLADRRATPDQLRYVVARMAESLRDVHRIARSRGARLGPVQAGGSAGGGVGGGSSAS
jgi:hypothetical protein